MPKPAPTPTRILPIVLHVAKNREWAVLLCAPPGLRAGQGGHCLQKCTRWGSALMCLWSFRVCSRAGDKTRRDCALDGPPFELLPGPCKPITFPKPHPCLNWFTRSLSLLNCKLLWCRSHLSCFHVSRSHTVVGAFSVLSRYLRTESNTILTLN